MVNEVVLNYFKKYKDKFPLEALKQKALEGGYKRREVEEAVSLLNKGSLKEDKDVKKEKPDNLKEKKEKIPLSKEGYWMRFSGFLGLFFLGLFLVFSILLVFGVLEVSFFKNVFVIIIGYFLAILLGFYYYGFVILGKITHSKIVRMTSVIHIFMVIFYIIISLIVSFYFLSSVFFEGSLISMTGFAVQGSGGNTFFGNLGLQQSLFVSFPSWVFWIFVFYGIFVLTVKLFFSVGLIKLGEKIKFAKIAGVFDFIWSLSSGFGIIYFAYLFLNPHELYSGGSLLVIARYFSFFSFTIFIFSYLFESLSLINASKEKG